MQKLAAITKEPRNADWRSGTLSMYHKDLTTTEYFRRAYKSRWHLVSRRYRLYIFLRVNTL